MTKTDRTQAEFVVDTDQILRRLRDEFIDSARESLAIMNSRLDAIRNSAIDFNMEVLDLQRRCHNIKGQGTTFGFSGVSVIAHRMEDYLGGISHFGGNTIPEIFVFLDWMDRSLANRQDYDENELTALVRRLPTPPSKNAQQHELAGREALLIVPLRFVISIVRSGLEQLGLRCVAATSAIEGLVLAVHMRPDVVVLSAVMDGLSGVDVACALRAMSVTQDTPMIMITSLDADDASLARLPSQVERVVYDRMVMSRTREAVVRALAIDVPIAQAI